MRIVANRLLPADKPSPPSLPRSRQRKPTFRSLSGPRRNPLSSKTRSTRQTPTRRTWSVYRRTWSVYRRTWSVYRRTWSVYRRTHIYDHYCQPIVQLTITALCSMLVYIFEHSVSQIIPSPILPPPPLRKAYNTCMRYSYIRSPPAIIIITYTYLIYFPIFLRIGYSGTTS